MDQRRQQIESSIFNKQWTIWAEIDVFWTMQLAKNISIDDKQYILRTIT